MTSESWQPRQGDSCQHQHEKLCEQQAAGCSEDLQDGASLGSLWELTPQLRKSAGGVLGKETLEAVWLEDGPQIRRARAGGDAAHK